MDRDDTGASEPRQEREGPTDAELDAWIMARLAQAGVDLSVLPEEDDDAPADRASILASARRFLRNTPPAILAFEMDVQDVPPAMYTAELMGRTSSGEEG